jgi:hypothetical protein
MPSFLSLAARGSPRYPLTKDQNERKEYSKSVALTAIEDRPTMELREKREESRKLRWKR